MDFDRCKNCHKPLHGLPRDTGYCSRECKKAHESDKRYESQKALEAFKKEGEPNKGASR